jgi:DNA-binding MurR/RpiR family transcriptional regulator
MSTDPPLGGTLAYVRSIAPSLGPSEQRVAQVCLDRPQEVAAWSAADLAAAAGTAPSTVVRACQTMGFNGFQQLRYLLVRDLGAAGGSETQTEGDMLGAVLHRVTQGVSAGFATIDRDTFEQAVAALAAASRTVVIANGASGPVAQHLRNRFLVQGIACEAPQDAVLQQVLVRQLSEDDVVVAISDSGMNSVTLNVIESAKAGRATIVAITSYARSDLSELADHTLLLGATEAIQSRFASHVITQMVLLNALELAVLQHRAVDPAVRRSVLDEVFGHIVRPE